ncbi:coiled-coil domain-containing protein 174-like [Asterias rubens]|uniref:coiled-coil domain-containing protein 174-like n=1 Tax=Asterias rubens TaxID=7604 RepID=UPI0014550E1D|nr:coiled-coil domain-containing protein 174-like [Asterias rubens]
MNSGKKIEVNSSSLVGLKAELFRKQEALRKERLQQNSTTVKAKPVPKKASIWTKKNAGVQSRAEKDKVLTAEEENALDKSRKALEAKTKLYEQMSKGAILTAEDDAADHFLVDFEKKAIGDMKEKRRLKEEEEEAARAGPEYEMGATDVPGPVDSEDQWVDYVDTLGRSRRCMKKDLPELINMDKRLNPQAFKEKDDKEKAMKQEALPDLLSSDMHREMMRKKWEAEEEEMRSRGPGPLHYQNLKFDEVREMGVGYFDFSKDEGERQSQMEMLSHLRGETLDQRTKSEQLKAKRKAALKARLDKVKQRKRAKGEIVEEEGGKDHQEEEEDARIKEEAVSARRRQKEEDEKRLAERLSKTAPARPWDIGKEESQWDRVKKQVREERPQEFAPPQQYNWMTPSTRQTPKKSKFASTESYDDTLSTSKRLQEFAPPSNSAKWNMRQGVSASTSEEGISLESKKSEDHGRQAGESNQGEDFRRGGIGAKVVSEDSIAQALSFFRSKAKK